MKRFLAAILILILTGIPGCEYDFPDYDIDKHIITPAAIEENPISEIINPAASEEVSIIDYDLATLIRVVDGDTLVVSINGEKYKVRLIGIDSPESVHSDQRRNTEEGLQASEFTKFILEEVQILYMTSDISDTDKYGRLLRYVWLDVPDEENIEALMLNAIILSSGYAVAKDYKPDVRYSQLFHTLQKEAEEQGLGIWAK